MKLSTTFFTVIVLVYSCRTNKNLEKNRLSKKLYNQYIYSVINDTTFYEFTAFDIADKNEVSGVVLTLVRPPFWNYDAHTLNEYHCNELQILLTDLI